MEPSTVLLIAGGILLLLSIVLIYFYKTSKQLIDEMWAVDTYEAEELKRLCSGGFEATVEVQGDVSCDKPLTSLVAGLECCWFRTIVKRESETTHTDTDSDGHATIRNEVSWQTAYDRTFCTIFKVNDKTGYTLVDPTRADIDTQTIARKVVYEREPWFENVPLSDTGKYELVEEAFFSYGYAYVLGQASCTGDESGDALIHYPEKGYLDPKKRFFIISRKTERELTRSKQISTSVCFWFAILAFFVAVYCLLAVYRVVPGPV